MTKEQKSKERGGGNSADPKNQKSMEERFDEIGFGNQARIVGVKRVELKDFINQELIRVLESLRMEEKKNLFSKRASPNLSSISQKLIDGYNQAVQELNEKIDKLKKEVGKNGH